MWWGAKNPAAVREIRPRAGPPPAPRRPPSPPSPVPRHTPRRNARRPTQKFIIPPPPQPSHTAPSPTAAKAAAAVQSASYAVQSAAGAVPKPQQEVRRERERGGGTEGGCFFLILWLTRAPPPPFSHAQVVAAVGQSFADKVTDSFNKFNYSSVPWDSIAHKVNSGEREREKRGRGGGKGKNNKTGTPRLIPSTPPSPPFSSSGADLAAKRVYKKVEGALPKVNETEASDKIQAPVRALNATKTAVSQFVDNTFTWAKPVGLNKTVNSPLVRKLVNKTLINPVRGTK